MTTDVFSDLYTNMLYDPGIVTCLSIGKGERINRRMQEFWGMADDVIYYVAKMLYRDDEDIGKALVFADYLAYVPFGELGYAAFDAMLKEQGKPCASEWRYARFVDILGKYASPKSAMDVVKQYFDDYLNPVIDPKSMSDITRAVCRILHNFETAILKRSWVEDDEESAIDALDDALALGEPIQMSDALALSPAQEALTEDQLALLKEIASE